MENVFSEYVDLIPEDKRGNFNELAGKAVILEDYLKNPSNIEPVIEAFSKDSYAFKTFAEKNESIQRLIQAEADRRKTAYEEKFKSEKLPDLVKAEIEKGKKTPDQIRIEKLEKDLENQKLEGLREKQLVRALAKAHEAEIPDSVVAGFIGTTDDETDNALMPLIKTLTEWRQKAVDKALADVGSQPTPTGGVNNDPKDLEQQYEAALEAAQKDPGNIDKADAVLALKSQLSQRRKKG